MLDEGSKQGPLPSACPSLPDLSSHLLLPHMASPSSVSMISPEQARHFASEWVSAWNSHDLDRILSHYSDDFSMTSPFIAGPLGGEPSGTLRGKDKVPHHPTAHTHSLSSLSRSDDLGARLLDQGLRAHAGSQVRVDGRHQQRTHRVYILQVCAQFACD